MNAQENGLRAAIKTASQLVQDTASKSEAAALEAVARAEAALASARDFGSEVAGSIGHAGRTSLSGVVEFNSALGRHGKQALTDTLEAGLKSIGARSAKEVV